LRERLKSGYSKRGRGREITCAKQIQQEEEMIHGTDINKQLWGLKMEKGGDAAW
jgi:hypothetical protein